MKAVVFRGVDAGVSYEETAEPRAEPGHLLVSVRAAGVNFVDVLLRAGRYAQAPAPPFVLGSEVAGDVVAVGDGVEGFAPGQRVMALTTGVGGFAELATVPAERAFPLPAGCEYTEGAAFLLTFLTAYIPLRRQVRVAEGSTVLVHAAAGGVGTAALQLVRQLGGRAIATASSARKLALAAELGAETTIDYTSEDVAARVAEATGGRGVDVVIDTVGGDVSASSLRLLAPLGSLVAIGYAGGSWHAVDPALLVGRNAGIHGFYLGRLWKLAPSVVREAAAELAALWEAGAVAPVVGTRLPLARADEALSLLAERGTLGKVVLHPEPAT